MKDTNRSLLIAVLACLSMGFFAKSPQFVGIRSWITGIFAFATLGLSAWGFWVGVQGAKRLNTAWGWLAPAVNAVIFIFFTVFLILLWITLERIE